MSYALPTLCPISFSMRGRGRIYPTRVFLEFLYGFDESNPYMLLITHYIFSYSVCHLALFIDTLATLNLKFLHLSHITYHSLQKLIR